DDADAAGDHTTLPDRRAAGDARSSRHRRVRPDAHVVGDLHEVVDLHAVLDDGVVDRAPVDRRVRADLDVVADDHRAELRHLDPAAVRETLREAEAVRADHGAGVHDAPAPDPHPVEDADARGEPRVVADLDALAERAAGADDRAL